MLSFLEEGTLPTPAEFAALVAAVLAAPTSPAYTATFKALISEWFVQVRPALSEQEIASFLAVETVATGQPNPVDDSDARRKHDEMVGLAIGLPILAAFVAIVAIYGIRNRQRKAAAAAAAAAGGSADGKTDTAAAPAAPAADAPVAV
jgi:hypothetical protein